MMTPSPSILHWVQQKGKSKMSWLVLWFKVMKLARCVLANLSTSPFMQTRKMAREVADCERTKARKPWAPWSRQMPATRPPQMAMVTRTISMRLPLLAIASASMPRYSDRDSDIQWRR